MHYFSLNCTPLLYPILLLHVISYILPLLCFTYNLALHDTIWSTVYFIPSYYSPLICLDLSYIFFLSAVADYALSIHQTECTSSCPTSEVKQRWVSLVLGWVTTWEQNIFLLRHFLMTLTYRADSFLQLYLLYYIMLYPPPYFAFLCPALPYLCLCPAITDST